MSLNSLGKLFKADENKYQHGLKGHLVIKEAITQNTTYKIDYSWETCLLVG